MALLRLLVCGLLGAGAASAAAVDPAADAADAALAIDRRALPNSPSGNYAPQAVDCPAERPSARAASGLSASETSWRALRRNNTQEPLIAFLAAANISGFDARAYVTGAATADVPTIGLAMSGGGYRALMNGAGFLAAADSRTPGQAAAGSNGSIAGLLQATTYLAGLSGGGWLVGSIFANNFSSVVTLRDGYADSDLWRFDNSIFAGPSSDAQDNGDNTTSAKRWVGGASDDAAAAVERRGIISTAEYWTDVAKQVEQKDDAGFDVSLTDYWGRALSYQLINAPDGGLDYTFSSIALTDGFASGATPFPILVADSRAPGTTVIALNSTVYEFNAFEMGSWDPTTYGFVPTEYLGSNFTNGQIAETSNASHCVRGFDQLGYVMGTSSTLFNQFLLANLSAYASVPSFVVTLIDKVLKDLGDDSNDIAQYVPNPFYGYHPATNAFADATQLTLVDGGEDNQNLPLHPLIQPPRALDVVLAVDSSADTDYNWPNGSALRASYARSRSPAMANGTLFPPVPDDHTFVNLHLNQRPTFFGCDAANFTLGTTPGGDAQSLPPLVVYVPNAPFSAWSNVSTFTPSYSLAQRNGIIQNGFNAATRGNGTLGDNWPTCLACAILSRSFTRTNTTVPQACVDCFATYCWDGTLNSTDYGAYEPTFLLDGVSSLSEENAARAAFASGAVWLKTVAAASATLVVLLAL